MSNNQSNRIYYPYFDYLRAACATAVMLYHSHIIKWEKSGDLAVQVFFALSGWLIGNILIKTKIQELHRFYYNRAIRIWIPYYIALIIAIGLSTLRDPISEKWIEIVIYKMTFVYNIFGTPQLKEFAKQMPLGATLNHVWSVNAEEQFYLLAPLLLVIGSKLLGRNPLTWLAIGVMGLTFNTYPAIILGILFSTMTMDEKIRFTPASKKNKTALLLSLAISTPALFLPSLYSIAAPIFSISLILFLATPGRSTRIGQLLGGMSYPLYLNHWIGVYAINYIFPNMRNTTASAIMSSILSIFLAMCMYVFIDRKLLANRDSWHSPAREKATTLTAYFLLFIGISYGSFNFLNK